MFRILVLVVLALLLAMPATQAQHHTHGWFVPGYRHLHYVDAGGKVTSVAFSTSYVYAGLMNWDNKTALAFDYSLNAIMQVDPVNLTVLGTLLTHPSLTPAPARWRTWPLIPMATCSWAAARVSRACTRPR